MKLDITYVTEHRERDEKKRMKGRALLQQVQREALKMI